MELNTVPRQFKWKELYANNNLYILCSYMTYRIKINSLALTKINFHFTIFSWYSYILVIIKYY